MTCLRLKAALVLAVLATTCAGASEPPSGPWAGPFPVRDVQPDGTRVTGVRPFYVAWTSPEGQRQEFTVLYPLFYYRDFGTTYEWSIFDLINRYRRKTTAPAVVTDDTYTWAVWPFYFSRESVDPSMTYHALVPIAGRIQDKLGFTEIRFFLFPLYLQTHRRGAVTTSLPWPFVNVTRGAEHGFSLWPLFGWNNRPGDWSRHYALWPFIWNNTESADVARPAGTGPTHEVIVLPFYAGRKGPGLVSENFLWPFFGYTDQTAPYRYHETRYFWPFFVQGRGEDHYHNRWGPFYTHSVVKGMDKTWSPWPLFRRARWQDGDIIHTKTQVYFFVYWKHEERKASNPAAAPAYKTHYWPFLSVWDNGAGRRQWQVLSPTEVFFPDNREMRETWGPFAAVYRHDEEPDGTRRSSLFWNAVTWTRRPDGERSWRVFALRFSHPPSKVALAASRPAP